MRITDMLGMSLSSLWKRKVRTILTILGVLIGTVSVVVMISLGIGMKQSMLDQINSFESLTMIEVSKGISTSDDPEAGLLDRKLVEELKQIPNVDIVVPILSAQAIVKYKNYIANITIYGMEPEGISKMGIELAEGNLPTNPNELELLFGNTIATNFFNPKNYEYPYYETGIPISVNYKEDQWYLILDSDRYYSAGTPDENGQPIKNPKKHIVPVSGLMAGGPEEWSATSYNVYANIDALETALRKEYKNRVIPGQPTTKKGKPFKQMFYSKIRVYADSMDNVVDIQKQINDMGYSTYAAAEWIQSEMDSLNLIQYALGGIGAVSLFVAAIGIINTMMMSIYERTKEIGVMKVIGCSLPNLQFLFLLEAGFIGFLGGIFGVGLSYGLSTLINKLIAQSEMGFTQISYIPPWLAVLAIIFAIVIGMVAGFIPSLRAMRLSPLEAMRT